MIGQLNISESNYKQTCRPQVTLSGALNDRKFKKIELHQIKFFIHSILFITTAGISLIADYLINKHQFKKAIQNGDIEKASSVLRWTGFIANVFINKTDIENLKTKNQTDFLKFLDKQIEYREVIYGNIISIKNRINQERQELNKLFESIPEIQAERRSLKVIKFLKNKPHSPADAEEQITPGLGIIMPQEKRNSSSLLSASFRTRFPL